MEKTIMINKLSELKVLHIVFHMFKYGVTDDEKKLEVISSPIFKKLFNEIREEYISHSDNMKEEFIEDNQYEFDVMKKYLIGLKKLIDDTWENTNWDILSIDKKREFIINLSSPYSIKEETISEFLSK